jgi:archaellum component FlaF (FlaF/FlaG flagellin family)
MAKHTTRRALATVVSTGILLSAVAVMGSMMTAWSNSTFANEQHEMNAAYSDGVNKLNEFLVIENVWFGNNPTKFVNVTTSNVGTIGLNVTKITLDNSIDKTNLLITDGGIVSNDYFSTEITYNWTTTDPIKITITTEKGSIYQTYVMGP